MLVVHARRDPRSRYSRYLTEILRSEGFSAFAETDLDELDDAALARAGLVILARSSLTPAESDRLVDFVSQGGKLIVFMPDAGLGRRLGLTPTYRSTATGAGYVWPNVAHPMMSGLCPEAIQTVVPATIWRPGAGKEIAVLADLRNAADPAAVAPAVLHTAVGRGDAVAFVYDLPHAIARLRQGDPAFADIPSSGIDHFVRPHDLFVHQLPPARQWLPQADLQSGLLARIVETLQPQPRVWLYPEAAQRGALVMTSDDDWSTIEQFETLLDGLAQRSATCSFYIVPGTKVSDALMTDWERAGHTFSVHPAIAADYGAAPMTDAPQATFVPQMVTENVERHQRDFGRPVKTTRNHAVRWYGYADQARLLAGLGVRLEVNYVSVAPLTVGYLCGSCRPLRFVDLDGAVIDCFQQPTAWTEEVLIHPEHPAGAHWKVERAIAETGSIIREAARRFHSPIAINSHPVSFATYSSPLIEADWDAALAEGMPILSADRWLNWTEARLAVSVEEVDAGWRVRSTARTPAVTVLFPEGTSPLADGANSSHQTIWGRNYDALTLRDLDSGERPVVRGDADRGRNAAASD
jgi:hypothetical protein